ncbi:MAG: hypothetical protein ISS01_02035 [Nanoarchaeota archaeon]|nr:hypothetical protein [Nanoarchaeota archaeon]
MKVFTSKRGPLFARKKIISRPMAPRVQVPQGMPHRVPIQSQGVANQKAPIQNQESSKPKVEEQKGFQKILGNKKIIFSAGILFVSVIAIVVVVAISLSYTNEVVEKSSILLPFLIRRKD